MAPTYTVRKGIISVFYTVVHFLMSSAIVFYMFNWMRPHKTTDGDGFELKAKSVFEISHSATEWLMCLPNCCYARESRAKP